MNENLLVKTVEENGHTIKIYYDECPDSPREWDNLGTIYANSRSCNPDNKNIEELIEKVGGNLYERVIPWNLIAKDHYYEKVWIYDHSGQTVSTGENNPYHCPWDSGLMGVIAVEKEKAKKEFGYKRDCPALRKRVSECLKGEVKTLDTFLRGEIYAYQVLGSDGELIDSCCGFYDMEEALAEARSMIAA